jgi:hypothetical protein
MKKIILFLIFTFLIIILPYHVSNSDNPSAQSGCCKERDSLSTNKWYENGLSFRRCRDLNNKRDDDDLYRRTGYVYWDEDC